MTVIAIGDRNDVGLFRDLINNGVSDYLVKPIAQRCSKVAAERRRAPQGHPSDRFGRLVAVAGARGGVGTTTLATGVAWTIAHRRRRRVALVDLDLVRDGGPGAGPGTLAGLAGGPRASRPDRRTVRRPRDDQAVGHTLCVKRRRSLGDPVVPDVAALDLLLKELRSKFLRRGRPSAPNLRRQPSASLRRPAWCWSGSLPSQACGTRCAS